MPPQTPPAAKSIKYRNKARTFSILCWRGRQECSCRVAGGLHTVSSKHSADRVVLSGFQAHSQLKKTKNARGYNYTTTIECTGSCLHFKVQCNSFHSSWSVIDADMKRTMNKFLSHVSDRTTRSNKTRKSAFLCFGLDRKSIAPDKNSSGIHEPLDIQQQMRTKMLAVQWTVENTFGLLQSILAPILQRGTVGRPWETERRFLQHLLTYFAAQEGVDGRCLKLIAGGKADRWEERLVLARARHQSNQLVEKTDREFWTPSKRRKDAMPDAICAAAKQFWCSYAVSRQMAANVNTDRRDGLPRYSLCLPPVKAHVLFIQSQQHGDNGNPDFRCLLEWFHRQRPPNVQNSKREYALCTYHLQDFHVLDALYRWLRAAHTKRQDFGKTTPARCEGKCMDKIPNLEAFREHLHCTLKMYG